MPKIHYFRNNFQKSPSALRLQRPLIFDSGDLKLRDEAKFCFFELIMMKSNFKKSVMRHQKTLQIFFILPPTPQSKFLVTPVENIHIFLIFRL